MKTHVFRTSISCLAACLFGAAPIFAQSAQGSPGEILLQAASPVLQGLCSGNQGPLEEQPLGGMLYLQEVVSPLHEQTLSWRIPPQILLFELDPMLPRALNTRMLTNPEFYDDTMQFGLDAGLSMLLGLAEAREQNMDTGAFDPAGEAAALMQGLVGGMGGLGTSMSIAERDATAMIALLMDPEALVTFRSCYDGIRAAVMEGS